MNGQVHVPDSLLLGRRSRYSLYSRHRRPTTWIDLKEKRGLLPMPGTERRFVGCTIRRIYRFSTIGTLPTDYSLYVLEWWVLKITFPYIYCVRIHDSAFLRYLLRIKSYAYIIPLRLVILSLCIVESTQEQEYKMAAWRLPQCYSVQLRLKSFPHSRTATAYSYFIKPSEWESTLLSFKNFS
jgi:hypothetical protein